MCGLIGIIGKGLDMRKELIEGLEKLEYRGYDSAGIGYVENGQPVTQKTVGQVARLKEKLSSPIKAEMAIAHTRWATNGGVSLENCHPHISEGKTWMIVHNGIIENADELRAELEEKGVHFYGQTDTEVVANLLERTKFVDPIDSIREVLKKIKGSYAIVAINKNYLDRLFIIKNKSPLYFSYDEGSVRVASDTSVFSGKNFISLNDGEFGEINLNNFKLFNKNGKINKKETKLEKTEINRKNNSNYYMIDEIHETIDVFKRINCEYKDLKIFNKFDKLGAFDEIKLIGCGTAYHSCLIGKKYLEEAAMKEINCYIASEFNAEPPKLNKNMLCIFVSQSGETADTLLAVEKARAAGAKTLAITNVPYSTISKKCKAYLPICAGREVGVASTKAYSAQVVIFYMLACHIKGVAPSLKGLISSFKFPDEEKIRELAKKLIKKRELFLIGRGEDYRNMLEAGLKIREISLVNAVALPAGELKHGTLALIDEDAIAIVLQTSQKGMEKVKNTINEISSRGGKVVFVSQFDPPCEVYDSLKLCQVPQKFMPLSSVVTFQLLAFYMTLEKNLNPDKPRNLAKSVTVE